MIVGLVLGVILGLMLAEQRLSVRHELILRAAGAIEAPGDVLKAMTVTYPTVFLAMAAEAWWRTAAGHDAAGSSWMASGVALFAASKWLKYWAIRSLGVRWSFRVLVQPGRPLVNAGPYRFVSHPNYVAVVGEIAGAAMMMGARWTGPVALVAFGVLLRKRVRVEERALGITAAAGGRG